MKISMEWAPAELCTVGTYVSSEAVRQEFFALISEAEIQLRIAATERFDATSLNESAQERSMRKEE